MDVPFTPEQEAELTQLANTTGKNPSELVQDAIARMLADRTRFVAGVNRGIAAAEHDDFLDHKEVVERIERRFRS